MTIHRSELPRHQRRRALWVPRPNAFRSVGPRVPTTAVECRPAGPLYGDRLSHAQRSATAHSSTERPHRKTGPKSRPAVAMRTVSRSVCPHIRPDPPRTVWTVWGSGL